MKYIPVESSNIAEVAYDVGGKVLEVEFKRGVRYRYFDVPCEVYAGLMNAESHGRYFAIVIRAGGFEFVRLGRVEEEEKE